MIAQILNIRDKNFEKKCNKSIFLKKIIIRYHRINAYYKQRNHLFLMLLILNKKKSVLIEYSMQKHTNQSLSGRLGFYLNHILKEMTKLLKN